MHRKRVVCVLAMGLAVGMLLTTPANAAKTAALGAAGTTIGGPMTVTVSPPSDAVAIFVDSINVCVTVVNDGKADASLDLIRNSPPENYIWNVNQGKSFTGCAPAIDQISILCNDPKGCTVSLRIDRY